VGKGKYDKVLRDLQKLPPDLGEDASYQIRINLAKAEVVAKHGQSPVTLAREWKRLRAVEDRVEAMAKKVRFRLRVYEQLIEETFEAQGISKFDFTEGGSVGYHPEPYSYVEDKDVFRQWCVDEGLLSSMSLAWQTTNSLTKERLLAGEAPPPGVKVYAKAKFTLHK